MNQPALRVVDGRDENRELRRYAQSTSEHSDSPRTFPSDSRSSAMASDSEQGRVPYTTLRKWPKETRQRFARECLSGTVIDFQKVLRSMAHSHHSVIENQSPSREFTNWWQAPDNPDMENSMAETRRRNLARLIERDFGGNKSEIARAYDPDNPKPQYFSDLLRPLGGKSFGEKAARKIEEKTSLKPGQLDIPNSPLIHDESKRSRVKEELRLALDDLDKDEQRELLDTVRKIQARRHGRRKATA